MGIALERKDIKILELERALEESIKLQSHYTELLNQHDGGHRKTFKNKEAWLNRLEGTIGEIR